MKRREAIRAIKAAARSRDLVFTDHAPDGMEARGETKESVSAAIDGASAFTPQADGSFNVRGDGLAAVVALRGAVIVVTVYIAG